MGNQRRTELFDYLLIGLKEYISKNQHYPYPDLLIHGMNALALDMKKSISFPKTMQGFLNFMKNPVTQWCPHNWIPSNFDGDFGLLDEGSLSEEANDYLFEVLLLEEKNFLSNNTLVQQLELDNNRFRKIFERLQSAYNEDNPDKAQQEYEIFRQFIIQHPYTTGREISKTFRLTEYIDGVEVGDLYDDCEPHQIYWKCDLCGILSQVNRQLKGLKPSLCSPHDETKSYVHRVLWRDDLRKIKQGIAQRVCFPGIPEFNLYENLKQLQTDYGDYLKQVKLYPGIDRYDLQLRFSDDTVWAIDFKDVRNPYKLAKNLQALYSEGNLHYDQGFYVISDRCIAHYDNYAKIVKEEAKNLPTTTQIISNKDFVKQVKQKLTKLAKGGN